LGHPTYTNTGPTSQLLPGLCNSNGAVGYYYIDTTQLANGVHTIAWVAFDSAGHGDGLGADTSMCLTAELQPQLKTLVKKDQQKG